MAGSLTRCGKCSQPILSDARCCPHCAVAKPAGGRRFQQILLAVLAAAVILLSLHRFGVPLPSFSSRLSPTKVAVTCEEKGGVVVQVQGPQGASIQRCAVKFDDDAPH